jgi:hypothetical protein
MIDALQRRPRWLEAAIHGDFSFGCSFWVRTLDIQSENLRSVLHWLYLAMASLLRVLFRKFKFTPRWKPTIFNKATMALVNSFFLRGVSLLENLLYSQGVVFGGCLGPLVRVVNHCVGVFFCIFSFMAMFTLIVLTCSWCYSHAEARCIWYFINIDLLPS